MDQLINGDCLQVNTMAKCIIMDPPDNIGLRYDVYVDKRPDYDAWMFQVVRHALQHCEILWISHHAKNDLLFGRIVSNLLGRRTAHKIIWRYTFGQYNDRDFANGYRPIWLIKTKDAVTYDVREESERMRLGDKRASGLRFPDDVWDMPRVVGNSRERRKWHSTQHPTMLYQRILDYSCSANDTVIDYFAGSGTLFRTQFAGRRIGVELSSNYCAQIKAECPGIEVTRLSLSGNYETT